MLATVSDKKIQHSTDGTTIDYYNADVVTAQDYYPGGMQMPGRTYSIANTNYRYGFNGKELDKETSSTTTYDYGFRIYSPALGRFLSVDPLTRKYPYYSPYQYAGNKPTWKTDIDGLEEEGAAEEEFWKSPEEIREESEALKRRSAEIEKEHQDRIEFARKNLFTTRVPSASDLKEPTGLDALGSTKPAIKPPSYIENALEAYRYWEEANGNGVSENIRSRGIVKPPVLGGVTGPKNSFERATAIESFTNDLSNVAKNTTVNGKQLDINTIKTYLQGSGDKFIIIGRGQPNRINPYAEALKKAGYNVETINDTYTKDQITPAINDQWVNDRLSNGFSVIDIGLEPFYENRGNTDKGDFYSKEIEAVEKTNITSQTIKVK